MTNKRKLSSNQIKSTTQKYLDFSEVKDDIIIMKDGTLRVVLMVSSLNFSLKSAEEQESIVSQYVNFLNTIEFPVQIVVQSRELNIDSYIARLKEKEKAQTNELLKLQTGDYIQYIQELVSIGRIMSKFFYIIIPYNPLSDSHKTFWQSLQEMFRPITTIKIRERRFIELKESIGRRIDKVMAELFSMGLSAVQLDTPAIIELLYNTYNPRTSSNERLPELNKTRAEGWTDN